MTGVLKVRRDFEKGFKVVIMNLEFMTKTDNLAKWEKLLILEKQRII